MDGSDMTALFLVVSVFLACAVEAVEALTIVLAVGTTRGWRSALQGVAAGLGVLAVVVAVLGPALTVIPLGALRLLVGGLLLVFGLQWLRKAVLRASGFTALHDETAIHTRQVEAARAASGGRRLMVADWYAFTLSFKGVLLEGLEVAFIALTFGANQGSIPLAALGAGVAVLAVAVTGVAVRAPLARVPENTMKFAVGVMLTSFGMFWGAEGAGASWPGEDAALLGVLAFVLVVSLALVAVLRRVRSRRGGPPPAAPRDPETVEAS
ncbi:MAG: COG4280 domain-containing protein [Sciscionella sp.]